MRPTNIALILNFCEDMTFHHCFQNESYALVARIIESRRSMLLESIINVQI